MKLRNSPLLAFASVLALALPVSAQDEKVEPAKVNFPAEIDHAPWDALLKTYVDERGLVDYAGWKKNTADMAKLDAYLLAFSPRADNPAEGDELVASTINAYNAFAINYILMNYPLNSIQEESTPFTQKLWEIGGENVSLDDIEKGTSIPEIGWKAHGVFVCCAISCPPLQRDAYVAATLDSQIDAAFTEWLSREDLNRVLVEDKVIEASQIFEWYKSDFEAAGGAKEIFAKYAPTSDQAAIADGDYEVEIIPYNWGLNDQGKLGENYGIDDKIISGLKKLVE